MTNQAPPIDRWIVFIDLPLRRPPTWQPYVLAKASIRADVNIDRQTQTDRVWISFAVGGGQWLDVLGWSSWIDAPAWMLEPHQRGGVT